MDTALDIEYALQIAVGHHQAGRPAQAEVIYRQVLAVQPRHPEALHLLGVLANDTGHSQAAVEIISRAISEKPDKASFHLDLGEAYRCLRRTEDSVASYKRALAIRPDYAEAYYNLGNALLEQDQREEAVTCYERALAVKPDFVEVLNNLGNTLSELKKWDEAIACFRRALALRPDYAGAHNNLGIALSGKGERDEAVACLRQALVIDPHYAEAHCNLGIALSGKGELDNAEECFRQALSLDPNSPEACYHLGVVFSRKGQLDQAAACLEQALVLKPDYADAQNDLGNVYKDQARLDEALECFRRTAVLAPDEPLLHGNLIYLLYFHPDYDAGAIFEEHRQWAKRHEEPRHVFQKPHVNTPDPQRRLKVGYVSPDLREHPVGRGLLPLFEHHDHEEFEIFCYSATPWPDLLTKRLRDCADHWRETEAVSEERLTEQIRKDGIDILVDLSLHLANNRLTVFARKPAPVQVTFAGYPGTTGLNAIDYRLTDPYLDPPETSDDVYSEQSIRLPHSFWCYAPLSGASSVGNLPAHEKGFITFGCLNNFCKINPFVLKLWASVLSEIPQSRLLLVTPQGSHRERTRETLQKFGIAGARVQFANRCAPSEFLALHRGVDIILDSFPYNGHTTSLDALWMGVPVVSLAGNTAVSRGGLSILSNIGLPELVAHSEEDYTRIALDLAQDLPRLVQLRKTLRERMQSSPLMDARRFARSIEDAYRAMWRKWCAGKTGSDIKL